MRAKRRRNTTSEKEIFKRVHTKTFREKIKKAQKEELNTKDLEQMMKNITDFLGVFPCDQISSLRANFQTPKFLIVNLDGSFLSGSHWIGLRIDKKTIEIFDSLGFDLKIWKILPLPLLNFLNSLRKTRALFYSPVLQLSSELNCGLYCAYFILYRKFRTFSDCLSVFNMRRLEKNQSILINLLS